MAYKLEFQPQVKLFFRSLTGLSRQGRIRLFANLHASLANVSDAFRHDPANRTAPGSSRFVFLLLMRDTAGGGRIHQFRFIVDDAAAPYGILRLVKAAHRAGP